MDNSPDYVDQEQLDELHIELKKYAREMAQEQE
jgi:hypothetical protein